MTTTTPCQACGFACEAAFAFCPRCGARQAPGNAPSAPSAPPAPPTAEHEADRRQVTVLFADLTGFTALAERLDPETVRAFQNALFETMAAVIARYDGFVEKFVGDAVMAVFGAPHAHEDDPLRALQAAQALLRDVEALGRHWAPRLGRAVTLHIGVHTGPVVAGSLGSGAGAGYAVTGDTVNCASRLLGAAAPGTVLVSAATQAIVRDRCAFEPASALEVRGRAEPLRVHRLILAADDAGAPLRGLEALGLRAPLVGRHDALAALQAAFANVERGRAQVVQVIGEAGVGKSRLLDEWLGRLDASGHAAAIRRTACSSRGEPTYGTFAALFRDAYRVGEDDSLAVAQRKLHAGLAELGADAQEADAVAQVLSCLLGMTAFRPQQIEPEQLQRQITLAARALIERRLAQQPLVIVIDDLQWADAASVELLGRVADQLADRPLMLLITQRTDAPAWPGSHVARSVIALGALPGDAARALVDALLGAAPEADAALAALRDNIVARAGGNPLFVEEIVRSLIDAGELRREHGRWSCGPGGSAAAVPPTLYGLLLSRIDRLAPDERRALQEAAILGTEFDAALLQRVAADPTASQAALARLAAHGLIVPDTGDPGDVTAAPRWRFTHALLHEVVYQNLLLARRTELHGRAGAALESLHETSLEPVAGESPGPRRLAQLEALGHHWSLSADKLRGARYLLAAADWARSVYANQDALRHAERALRTLEAARSELMPEAAQHATVTELDARERIADLLALQGRRADALAQYEHIAHAAPGLDDAARHARVLRKTGGLHWEAGERERALACFDAGLARLGPQGDAIERAHLFQEMGRLAFRAGEHEAAVAWGRRALAELPDDGATRSREAGEVQSAARNTLGVALARLGRTAEAVQHIETAVTEAEAQGLLHAACRSYTNLGVLYATLDSQRCIDTCLRGLQAAQRVGDLGFESRLYANLAVAYCALTNRCEAEGIDAAQAAISLDRRLGLVEHLAVPLVVLGQIHQCHGNAAHAFAAYREALELAEQIDEPQLMFPCYDGMATLYLDAGRPAEAEALLAKAQAVCERAGVEPDALMVLPFLC